MAQRDHEQRQTDTVGEQPKDHCARDVGYPRRVCTQTYRERQIDRSGSQSFDRSNPGRICERDLAREIVVDAPSQARAEYCHRWPDPRESHIARPREDHSPRHDGGHSQRDPAIEVLSKHEPRQQRRECTFRVQQQGGAGSGHARQPEHQQHRACDTACQYGAGEPQDL